ncbi:hypothetical protein C9I56_32755 [Paraburkholderia caribensis]|nr:hypothetical protein C9I56_32755 [Paraburkholderia caribensis]
MTVDMLSRRPLNVPRYASSPNRRSGSAVLFRFLNRKFFRALRCSPTNDVSHKERVIVLNPQSRIESEPLNETSILCYG